MERRSCFMFKNGIERAIVRGTMGMFSSFEADGGVSKAHWTTTQRHAQAFSMYTAGERWTQLGIITSVAMR